MRNAFRMLDVVADGTVRCRKPAAIEVEFVRLQRSHCWCEECFDGLWGGNPSAAEVFDCGEILR